jgi:hypothetical protein
LYPQTIFGFLGAKVGIIFGTYKYLALKNVKDPENIFLPIQMPEIWRSITV